MEEEEFFTAFADVELDRTKRKCCKRCGRPSKVCICSCLPQSPVSLHRTTLHILQHPNETRRPLHTVSILKAALTPESCVIYRGRRFGKQACPEIHQVLSKKRSFLLYPRSDAENLEDVVLEDEDKHYDIIILDGTWKQAASLYTQNGFLHSLRKVQLQPSHISEYVIRTQPTNNSLSTVECAALALELTESNSEIKEVLLKPLRDLCKFQLDCGATIHHSKEALLALNTNSRS